MWSVIVQNYKYSEEKSENETVMVLIPFDGTQELKTDQVGRI